MYLKDKRDGMSKEGSGRVAMYKVRPGCYFVGSLVRNVLFTTAVIARLMVSLPPKLRCWVFG